MTVLQGWVIISIRMIEFNKIFCDLHPNELVSNYCAHEQCNIALCATCICSHTENHVQRRTAPDYQNIRATYSNMQDQLRTRISALQHQKSRINLLIENIHCKRKQLSETIIQARHETLDFVNKFYDAKEKELMRKIESDEKKLGLHNENRMETLINVVSRDVNSLFLAAQELNSQNFLENFNRIRTQVLANSLQTQKDISQQLDKNENYEVFLNINPIYINDVKTGLEKSLTLLWDEKSNNKPSETREKETSANKSSRLTINPNQNSGLVVQKRVSDSMPKSTSAHPSRCTSSIIQKAPSFGNKPIIQQPVQYLQPQPHMHPQMHRSSFQTQLQPRLSQQMLSPHHQSFSFRPEPFIVNNSMPIQINSPNNGSRISIRPNSSQKNVKQNGRNPLAQSYIEGGISNMSNTQIDPSKKMRKTGLTVLRSVDNQKN